MAIIKPGTADRSSRRTAINTPPPVLLRSVGLKTFWDERRSLVWWSSGAAILSAIIVMLYPSIAAGPELEELIERLPPALRALMGEHIDLTTAPGYVNLRLFTFVAPIIFLVYSIGRGTSAVAGEEIRGTMDLLLAHPVKRWRVVVEKSGEMIAGLVIIGFGLWIGIVIGAVAVGVDLNFSRAAQATLMGLLLAIFHGSLALAIGGATGRTGPAIGGSAAVGIAGYFLHTLAPLVDWLEPFQILSPFYYYIEDPAMLQGMNLGHAIVLTALSVILVAIAVVTFQRRDVQM
jgi:ABC-2 type transport system permease protein